MNLSELRSLVLDLRSWGSSTDSFNLRLNRAINLAYRKMSKDVPEVLVPTVETHHVFKDQTTADTKAYITQTTDKWVLEFKDAAGTILHSSSTATWRPQVNGTWDGLMHIEVTDTDNIVHRFRCREFWENSESLNPGDPPNYYVSLDRPHFFDTNALRSFRIYQPNIFLKSDYIRVVDAAAWDSEYENDQLQRLDVGLVDRLNLRDFRGENKGTPNSVYQGSVEKIPGPRSRPELSNGTGDWAGGAVAKGRFKFRYTYVWGVASEKEGKPRRSPGGLLQPIIESPPSPTSTAFEVTSAPPRITFADVDRMYNFGEASSLRQGRTGLKIRLYAARVGTVDDATMGSWPIDEQFYPIADIDPPTTSLTPPTYDWTGSTSVGGLDSSVPDLSHPLSENQVYRAWSLYPHQDKDFRVDFRVLRLPEALPNQSTDPSTAGGGHPMVEPDAESALVEIVLYYLSLMDGADQAAAQVHLGNYAVEIKSVRAQHASPSGNVMPATWDEAGTRDWNLKRFEEV